jgi:hypothetical protein
MQLEAAEADRRLEFMDAVLDIDRQFVDINITGTADIANDL